MPPWLRDRIHPNVPVEWWHGMVVLLAAAAVAGALALAGGAAEDDADDLTAADALVYVHLQLGQDTDQFRRARRLARRFPSARLVLEAVSGQLRGPRGGRFDFEREIRPWLGAEAALAISPHGRRSAQSLFMLEVGDEARARRFLRRLGRRARRDRHRGTAIQTYGRDFVTAFVGGFLLIGQRPPVERAIDADRGRARSLADLELAKETRDGLPDDRLADVYASREGVDRLLAGRGDLIGQVGSLVQSPRLRGVALALVAEDDSLDLTLERTLRGRRGRERRAAPAERFEPSLADRLPEATFAYLGVSNLDATLDRQLATAMIAIPGFSGAFERFRRRLGREGQVDLQRQLLPLLRGEAAASIAPGRPAPVITVIVDDVDEDRAKRVLARLQGPLARAIRPREGQAAPTFRERKIDGIEAFSIQLLPTIDLTYALFDGRLVVTTDPLGIQRIRQGRARLDERDAWEEVFEDAPGEVSTLVFLDLEELLGQLERAGLGADPGYALIREDIRRLGALGAAISDEPESTRVEISLAVR